MGAEGPAADAEPDASPAAYPAAWQPARSAAPAQSPFAAARPAPVAPAAAAQTATPHPQASGVPARKESTLELVAFGLVAAGAVVGIAGLFLPWTAVNGIGIGTTMTSSSPPPPNQWGWGMPAGIPLFLLSALVLGAATGSDRAQERLPNLASVIARVTGAIIPMILGGLYLGVFLLYLTLPWGFGTGVFALMVGAGLLIAGAVVTLFLPPDAATNPGAD